MKFSDITVGQRFRFEGRVYVKSGPLIARDEGSGGQRFIRRSAAVETISGQAAAHEPRPPNAISPDALMAAADAYHRRCLACVDEIAEHLPTETREQLLDDIEDARREFNERLGLDG